MPEQRRKAPMEAAVPKHTVEICSPLHVQTGLASFQCVRAGSGDSGHGGPGEEIGARDLLILAC